MRGRVTAPGGLHLPALTQFPKDLELERSQITTYDLNPFSLYVCYDRITTRNVDIKVQEFGQRFKDDEYAEEPTTWAMVKRGGRWHRAQVLEKFYSSACHECSGAEVSLVDSGHRVVVDVKQIFPIPKEVLAAGPSQSLRILPKGIESSPRVIHELLEYYPEARFRLRFDDDLNRSSKQKPHLAGTLAHVEVGHKGWISLERLLLLNLSDGDEVSTGSSRTTAIDETRSDVNSRESRESVADGDNDSNRGRTAQPLVPNLTDNRAAPQSSAIKPEAEAVRMQDEQRPQEGPAVTDLLRVDENWFNRVGEQLTGGSKRDSKERPALDGGRDPVNAPSTSSAHSNVDDRALRSAVTHSDDDSSSEENDLPVTEAEENIRYTARTGTVPLDVEGEKQSEISTARSIANAQKVARSNQHREKICAKYRKTGACPDGELCPHAHWESVEKTMTNAVTSVEFRDYPDIVLQNGFTGFGLCTHVDEDGMLYVVLPYGVSSIWEVLECKPTLKLELREIMLELSRLYDPLRKKKPNPIHHSEQLGVVFVDKSDSGPLLNVRQGWYRAKILKRVEKKCHVFLVDHGATITTNLDNLYPLEKDLLLPQQAIRCHIQDTVFRKRPGDDLEMYEVLRRDMIIIKVYEQQKEQNPYEIELFEITEGASMHYGELLAEKGIIVWND